MILFQSMSNRQFAIGNRKSLKLNLRLAVRHHPQQSVYCQVQNHVSNDCNDNRQQQLVGLVCVGDVYDASKRSIKRIGDRDNKLNKTSSAPRCQQRQQETHAEQRVQQIENVIDDL